MNSHKSQSSLHKLKTHTMTTVLKMSTKILKKKLTTFGGCGADWGRGGERKNIRRKVYSHGIEFQPICVHRYRIFQFRAESSVFPIF